MCSCNYLLRKLTSIFRPDGEYFQVFPKLFIKKCCERIQYSLFYKIMAYNHFVWYIYSKINLTRYIHHISAGGLVHQRTKFKILIIYLKDWNVVLGTWTFTETHSVQSFIPMFPRCHQNFSICTQVIAGTNRQMDGDSLTI